MAWLMPLVVVALAALGPFFGADSRDRVRAARWPSAGQNPR
jgi:hypothetical protein